MFVLTALLPSKEKYKWLANYVDNVFTETGLSNWHKALQIFDKLQQSPSHKLSANLVMRERRKARRVNEMFSSAHA